jgi:hypothetical protein
MQGCRNGFNFGPGYINGARLAHTAIAALLAGKTDAAVKKIGPMDQIA